MKTLAKLAQKRNTIPVLETILVENGVARSTNLDMHIIAPTSKPNGIYSGHGFDSDIDVKLDWSEADYPLREDYGKVLQKSTQDLKVFLQQLTQLSTSMSKEETRYYLCGICFTDDWHMVSTDGHRMTVFKSDINLPESVIVPSDTVKNLVALIKEKKKETDSVSIVFFQNGIRFVVGDTLIESKYIQGTFPQYKNVVPDVEGVSGAMHVQKDIKDVLKVAKPMNKAIGGNSVIVGTFEGSDVTLFNGTNSTTTFPLEMNIGDSKIGFNLSYLSQIPDGVLYIKDSGGAVLIEHNAYDYTVLMPTRLA